MGEELTFRLFYVNIVLWKFFEVNDNIEVSMVLQSIVDLGKKELLFDWTPI